MSLLRAVWRVVAGPRPEVGGLYAPDTGAECEVDIVEVTRVAGGLVHYRSLFSEGGRTRHEAERNFLLRYMLLGPLEVK